MGTIQSRGLLKQFCQALDDARDGGRQDQHLVQEYAVRRDPAAFTALVQRHGPLVLGVCRRVLHDPHDADDAFQATFLVLVRKAASIRKRQAVGSWLYGVAYRLASKLKVQAARRRSHESQVVAAAASQAGDLTWNEARGLVDEELSRLPERFRVPLLLCYLEGKTQDEAARQLEWSFGTFRRRLERGRELLHSRLTGRGVALSAALFPALLAQQSAASVPAALLSATCEAAALFASGQTSTEAAALPIILLAEGFMRSMLFTKLKIAAGVLAVLGLCGVALGVWGQPSGNSPVQQPVVAELQAKAAEQPRATTAALAEGQAGFPRRLFAISVNNYPFASRVSPGAGERTVDKLIKQFAERLSIPADQVALLSDAARITDDQAPLPPLSAAELARLSDEEVQRLLAGTAAGPYPPTKAVIEHNVRRFLDSCRPQDRIVLLFIGHAVEFDGQAYLAPLEAELTEPKHLIPMRWLYDRLTECKARQKVLLVDVCRFDVARGEERGMVAPMGRTLDAVLAKPPEGVQVLSACIAGQHSHELDNPAQAGVQGGIVLNLLPQLQLKDVPQRPEDSLPLAALAEALVPRARYLARAFLKQEQTPRLSGAEVPSKLEYDPKLPAAPRFKIELVGTFAKGIATRAEVDSLFTEIAGLPAIRPGSVAVAFEKQVLPIFQTKCAKCHLDTDKYKAGLDLRTVASIKKGGTEGPAVVPHDLKKSLLWEMVEGNQMPPQGFPQLTAAEKDTIKKWILTGAKDNKEAALTSDVPGLDFDALPPFASGRLAAYAPDDKTTPLREKLREAIALLKEPGNNELLPEEFPRNFNAIAYQQRLGLLQFKLDTVLDELDGLQDDRAKEPKRWQSIFDFVRARIAARCAHLAERNAKIGELRKGLPPFDAANHTGWQLVPAEKLADRDAQKYAQRARGYLDGLRTANAGTPWESLAKREKQVALGLEWRAR